MNETKLSQFPTKQHQHFKLLVFDWDGTLADSTHLISHAIQNAFSDLNLPIPTDTETRFVIGLHPKEAIQQLAPKLSLSQVNKIIEKYAKHYLANDNKIQFYPSVLDSLHRLKELNFHLAIATNKSRIGLSRALEFTNSKHLFEITICAEETFFKPNPTMLNFIIKTTGIDASRTLMIGDTSHDLLFASNANVSSLALTYGAHPLEKLLLFKPIAYFDNFGNLTEWIIFNS